MRRKRVITDTGPLIHLEEINAEKTWTLFPSILVPDIVVDELHFKPSIDNKTIKDNRFTIGQTNKTIIKTSQKLFRKYNMGRNDSIVLAHGVVNNFDILFTDDLKLRTITKLEHIRPVGSAGILYLSFLYKNMSIKELFTYLDRLMTDSSSFITWDIVEKIKKAAQEDIKQDFSKSNE